MGFQGGLVVKNLPVNKRDAGDKGPIPGSGRSPEERHGYPLQYSCLENSMDRGVIKSRTRLRRHRDTHTHTCIYSIFIALFIVEKIYNSSMRAFTPKEVVYVPLSKQVTIVL